MYPIHWFESDSDDINYGFSLAPRKTNRGGPFGENITKYVLLEDFQGINYSLTMSVEKMTKGSFEVRVTYPLSDGDGYARHHFTCISTSNTLFTGETVKSIWLYVNDSNSVGLVCYNLSNIYASSGNGRIGIICRNGAIHVYENGIKIFPVKLESVGIAMNYFNPPTDTSNLAYCQGMNILRHIKFYDYRISKQQLLEDAHPLVVHYLLDGSGNMGGSDAIYQEECDASGAYQYNGILSSTDDTMTLQDVPNQMRDKCVSIPSGTYLKIPQPSYDKAFFLTFWIYPTANDQNVDVFELGSFKLSLYTADMGCEVVMADGETQVLQSAVIPLTSWTMLSVRHYDDKMVLYVNGVPCETTLTNSAISAAEAKLWGGNFYLSDYRMYEGCPTEIEIKRLYTGDVVIDDRCTFYASKLTQDETMETFGFTKGEIRAKGFAFLDDDDENSGFFDPDDGVLRIKDFKQV